MPTWLDPEGRTRAPEDTPDERDRPDMQPPLGSRLGRYILLHPIGEGGMGVVYAARDPELDRKVALKLVRASGRRASTRRARLLREAQALARLNHPNVVEVLDAGVVDARDWDPDADPPERVWIAMELVECDTLDTWQHRARPGWREIVDTFIAAGRGLHAAHVAGLVHRDFKPENVLVGPGGRVRVTDFGLARPASDAEMDEPGEGDATVSRSNLLRMRLTRTGASVGTPAYMSPEQHRRETVDASSDQFNFCVGLYEALYQRPPFQGQDVRALAKEVAAGRVRPPPRKCAVPQRVFRVLRRGLSPTPADRWPSVADLLEALRRAKRPRRNIVVIGTVTIALAGVAWIGWPAPAPAGCASEQAPLHEVWSEERASTLEASLGGSGIAYAGETWARLRPRVDTYVLAWSDAYRATCETDAAQSEIRDQQMACLAEARGELEAVLEGLARAEAGAIRDAVRQVASLPRVDACRDPAALRREPTPPSDAAVRGRIASVRARLARLRAEVGSRDFPASLLRAKEALTESEQIGWEPLRALALYELGVMQQRAARHAEAQTHLEQAYFVADQAEDARTAAKAAIHLAYIFGATRSSLEEGLTWARHGRAALAKLGPDAELESSLANALGEIYFRHGLYDDAFEHHSRAVELAELLDGPESVDMAMGLNNLGNCVFRRGDTEAAAAHYARALEIREHVLGPTHPSVGASLSNLGSMERLLGRTDEAAAHLERALVVMENALGPEHPDVGNPLNSLFLVHSDRGQWEQARRYIERALAIWSRTYGDEHPNVAIGRSNLGVLLLHLGRPDEARVELEHAVEILESVVGPEHPNLGFPLATLGRAWLDLGDPERARAVLLRARALREAQGEGSSGVVIVDARLAEADVAQGRDREAAITRGRQALAKLREGGAAASGDALEVEAWIQRAEAAP